MAAANTFRAWLTALTAPALDGEFNARLVNAFGLLGDMVSERAYLAVRARMLAARSFPLDALPLLGSERMMPRYPSESVTSYRARLANVWDTWPMAGTARAIVDQLRGYSVIAVVKELRPLDWEGLAAAPDEWAWNWDGDAANWSRFWVVASQHPWSRWFVGDGHNVGAPGLTLGSTATKTELYTLRAVIRKWKAAHVVCSHIILLFDPDTELEPDGTWGSPPNRNPNAAYIRG